MKILEKPEIIQGLPPHYDSTSRIAIDTELFGLDPKRLHRPCGTFGSVACTNDGKKVYIVFDSSQVQEFMNRCNDGVQIYHNSAFDLIHLRRWATIEPRKRLWDSFLIERIMFGGYYDRFALKDLVCRYCDIYLEKESQKAFEKATEMTPELIEYAAKDV